MAQNSFKILDVPENATSNEIKTRYRQLVRFFHPDNFETKSDRSFAEDKLKEINAAYNSLVRAKAAAFPSRRPELLPEPVIFPTALNFGSMSPKASLQEMVYILNVGEEVEQFDIVYNQANPWLKVSQSRQLEAKKPFPMALTVSVDTSALRRGKRYQEWISIVMDSVVTKVPVSVHIPWIKFLAGLSWRMASLLLVVGFLFGTLSSLGIFYSLSGVASQSTPSRATFAIDTSPTPNAVVNASAAESLANSAIVDSATNSPVFSSSLISQTLAVTATELPEELPTETPTEAPTETQPVPPTVQPAVAATVVPSTPTSVPPTSIPPTAIPNTLAPQPTIAPTSPPPAPAAFMVVPDTYSVNARAGTSTEFVVLQELPAGTILPAIGRNGDSTWIYIRLADGREAWVFIDVIVINQDLLARLPVVR